MRYCQYCVKNRVVDTWRGQMFHVCSIKILEAILLWHSLRLPLYDSADWPSDCYAFSRDLRLLSYNYNKDVILKQRVYICYNLQIERAWSVKR